jgi:hypothetical protein
MKKNSRNLFILIFVLAAVATALAVWRLFLYKPKTEPQIQPPTPTPTIAIPKGRSEPGLYEKLQKEAQEKFPLISFVPHQEKSWSIDYLGPLHLEVVAKTKNIESIKPEVLNWIKGKGVDPDSHQIDWIAAP